MQLFNAKSFLTPLIDKRALGVILLVAIFFAVFRLSGGTVTTSTPAVRGSIDNTTTGDAVDLEAEFAAFESNAEPSDMRAQPREISKGSAPAAKVAASRPQSLNREDLLKQITGGNTNKGSEGDNSNSGRKLEDIEKSLGLR